MQHRLSPAILPIHNLLLVYLINNVLIFSRISNAHRSLISFKCESKQLFFLFYISQKSETHSCCSNKTNDCWSIWNLKKSFSSNQSIIQPILCIKFHVLLRIMKLYFIESFLSLTLKESFLVDIFVKSK